jgi:c-di-GMP-binding flagellar brake protein YcgR
MAKIKFTGPEKRAYLRISSRCAMKYTQLSESLRPLVNMITKLHTQNICAGGLMFVMRKKLPIRALLEFQFRIPGIDRYVAGLGEVVRAKLIPGRKTYDVGIKFLWVQQKHAELIDAYVRQKKIEQIIKKLHRK